MLAAVTEYHPGVPLVIGADFGHTEPQYVIPSGAGFSPSLFFFFFFFFFFPPPHWLDSHTSPW